MSEVAVFREEMGSAPRARWKADLPKCCSGKNSVKICVLSETLFAPGDSPFQAKGTVWLGIRMFVENHVPGGVETVGKALEPRFRDFFSQIFVAAGWYDILPIITISKTIGAVMGLEQMEYVRRSATWHAELDMSNVYKGLGQLPSPQSVCLRFASIHSRFYSFGKVEILEVGTNHVVSELDSMPAILAPWWQTAAEWYLFMILKAAGAKNGRITFLPTRPNGSQAGLDLVYVPARTVWD